MYKQVMPSKNQFYEEYHERLQSLCMHHVAVWASTNDEKVIGLISVKNSQLGDNRDNRCARLVSVPSNRWRHVQVQG